MVIRFGYCPPNPGPNAKLKNKWFTNISDVINEYCGERIHIKSGNRYRETTIENLEKLLDKYGSAR